MDDIKNCVNGLFNNDNNMAYKCLNQLESESCKSDSVYPYFDVFVEMLQNKNSYIRTRGIILIAVNAKWDKDYKVDEIVDEYLKHINDDKPITARQCIKYLPLLSKYKPNLKQHILQSLKSVNFDRYTESMQSLLSSDIKKCIKILNN